MQTLLELFCRSFLVIVSVMWQCGAASFPWRCGTASCGFAQSFGVPLPAFSGDCPYGPWAASTRVARQLLHRARASCFALGMIGARVLFQTRVGIDCWPSAFCCLFSQLSVPVLLGPYPISEPYVTLTT